MSSSYRRRMSAVDVQAERERAARRAQRRAAIEITAATVGTVVLVAALVTLMWAAFR